MNGHKKKAMWQYYIILGAGVILFVAALLSFKNTLSFLKKAEKATATVTSLREFESDGVVFSPLFTFRTQNNVDYTYELPEGTNPSAWSVGDTETVIYDPEDPSSVELYTYFRIFAWPLILISIALPLLVIGGGYFIANQFLK
ncbi:DUF3592 domain-containing protein (plasmid) [Chryseobacterium panacisoli]|uniref:DUF3592 domain-containing protein n=1 Tax=Chryseobacterium panacisoli TaxID=1807141 RepID=A0A5D9A101_9FLAO|nr:DUF3592 domain-containing protein [Chryseobacterium panacisoli]TZF99414.1 DUF3592 domain-containing protein [Chryseobacterium panacisoli]